MYFVHSVAGSMISMMHKLGMFRLRINYGVKAISDYLFHYEMSTLGCLIDSQDENNASRYYESFQCRMVAETVLRAVFSSMMIHDDLDAAMMHAMQSLTYNAIDLSLIPVLHERFIQVCRLFPALESVVAWVAYRPFVHLCVCSASCSTSRCWAWRRSV